MNEPSIEERVEVLERVVSGLVSLPAEVGALRTEMRERFDSVEGELRGFQDVVASNFTRLELKIDQKVDETQRLVRVLHEDLVSRIATMGEGRKP
jgi:hypothetical protein